jgi:hypothetical protein
MQRKRLRRSLASVVAVAIVALAMPAQAAVVDDPAFARGPLDLRRLRAEKHDAGAPIDLTMLTYGKWRARLLDVDGPNRISVLFNTDRTGGADFIGEIFFRDGHLWMRVERRGGTFVRTIRVYHPTRSSVRATIPRAFPIRTATRGSRPPRSTRRRPVPVRRPPGTASRIAAGSSSLPARNNPGDDVAYDRAQGVRRGACRPDP